MSQPLSVVSVIEKNRLSSETPFLIALDIDVIDPNTGALVETMYIVRNTEPIDFNGHSYQPAMFDIELKQEAGATNTVNLSIKDYTKAVQARMEAYGGGVGFHVTVMVVNAGALGQPPEVAEYFDVVGAHSANYVVNFTLGAENAITKSFPRRRQSRDYCQWRFRDPDTCGYSGPLPTCDMTLKGPNGCALHNNTIRFGGFPGINNREYG